MGEEKNELGSEREEEKRNKRRMNSIKEIFQLPLCADFGRIMSTVWPYQMQMSGV
jgi:CRISPR/Cas system-associated protein Cas7 (RAMP superfamily)